MQVCSVSLCWISRFIYCYAECHNAECRCAECCYVESRGAQHSNKNMTLCIRVGNDIIILNVNFLNGMAPKIFEEYANVRFRIFSFSIEKCSRLLDQRLNWNSIGIMLNAENLKANENGSRTFVLQTIHLQTPNWILHGSF